MGLLNFDDPESAGMTGIAQGLLAASGPSRMPVSFGQALAGALHQGQEGYGNATQLQMMKTRDALQKMQLAMLQKQIATKEALGRALAGQSAAQQIPEQPQAASPVNQFGGGMSVDPQYAPQAPRQPQVQAAPVSSADLMLSAALKAGDVDAYQEALKMKLEEKKAAPKFATEFRQAIGADGKLHNYQIADDGTIKEVALGVKPDIQLQDLGGKVVTVDKNAITPGTAMNKTMTPGESANYGLSKARLGIEAINADPMGMLGAQNIARGAGVNIPQQGLSQSRGMSGDALLSSVPQPIADQVKALAEGRMQFPQGFALKSPYWQNMISLVSQYDPTFDAVNYNKRSQTAAAFSKGVQGNAVRAVNQTLSHMGNLDKAIDALDNFNGVGMLANYVVNPVQEYTGDTRQGTFRQTVQAVSSELRKVFSSGGVGNLQELKQWEDSFPMNASKSQQKAYLKNGLELLQGAMGALDNQYREGMGPKASINDLITPKARAVISRISGEDQNDKPSAVIDFSQLRK